MLQTLPEPTEADQNPREQHVDGPLDVVRWEIPSFEVERAPTDEVPEGAPAWWSGEESAVTDLLRGMGIKTIEELPQ
jgi:hypothetical protein